MKIPWWSFIPVGIAGLIAALTGGSKQVKGGLVVNRNPGARYSVADWLNWITPLATAAKMSPAFIQSWIRVESGGKPCAWGKATSVGPDGYPREQGIGQFYNPDDFTRYGIKSGAFRVYCIPGTQECSRPLTNLEMAAQAKAMMDLVVHCRDVAGNALASVKANWNGKDVYTLTKLVHGLPGLVKSGMTLITAKAKRAPRDWQEYKAMIRETKMDSGTEKYRSEFDRLFANAENVTSVLPDDVKVVS